MAKIDLLSQDWCNLLFEEGNQKYGAYQLRAETGSRNVKSLIALFILLAIVGIIPFIVTAIEKTVADQNVTTVTQLSKLEEAKVEDKNIIKKVEPKQAEPQRIKSSIKFTAPVIKKDEEVSEDDELKSQKELGETKVAISIADVKGNDETHGKDIADIKEVITSQVDEEAKVFDFVEQPPVFPGGGDAALLKYINEHLKYPSIAAENGTQGTVLIRFVVTHTGEVGDVQVLKSVDTYLDREAVRVIKELPKFVPGRQQGKPVNVWFQVPVRFVLE